MKQHQLLVEQLTKPGDQILRNWGPADAHIIHMMFGIYTETGELGDALKKYLIYYQAIDLDNIIEELGDLEFYLEGLRSVLGLTRDQILLHNIKKLTKRYGSSYSDSSAKARRDKNHKPKKRRKN